MTVFGWPDGKEGKVFSARPTSSRAAATFKVGVSVLSQPIFEPSFRKCCSNQQCIQVYCPCFKKSSVSSAKISHLKFLLLL